MIPVVAARKLYDVQYEYVRNYLCYDADTNDVDTWSINPSKNTGVSLRLFEELGGYVSLEV